MQQQLNGHINMVIFRNIYMLGGREREGGGVREGRPEWPMFRMTCIILIAAKID